MSRKHGLFGDGMADAGETVSGSSSPRDREPERTRLADVVRAPGSNPLAAVVALLVACGFAYQAVVVALTHHPVLGALVVVVAAVAYGLADRLFAVYHRFVVAELARAGELDRIDESE